VTEEKKIGWSERLLGGLEKSRTQVWNKIGLLVSGNASEAEFEQIEEILFSADISPVIADELLDKLKKFSKGSDKSTNTLQNMIKDFLFEKIEPVQTKLKDDLFKFDKDQHAGTKVIMIVGVNGAGKTTTIGKLATKLRRQGASVVVGACDTFRAAAVEQLEVWCKRADVEIVKAAEGADPSAVAFDALKKAQEIKANYCIIDTAGRLHTKSNLMDELGKTKRVMSKIDATAPHEVLLVIDAITGQNALRQAEEFNKALNLTGLIFTKCDGSAKAGSAIGIVQTLQVPISYIGVGEGVEDINHFEVDSYLNALLGIQSNGAV
jgi:fused signal recognition particle receptor